MDSALVIHRLHFAFTITYHYLFPQLTVGLAPLIVISKSLALWLYWMKKADIDAKFGRSAQETDSSYG